MTKTQTQAPTFKGRLGLDGKELHFLTVGKDVHLQPEDRLAILNEKGEAFLHGKLAIVDETTVYLADGADVKNAQPLDVFMKQFGTNTMHLVVAPGRQIVQDYLLGNTAGALRT